MAKVNLTFRMHQLAQATPAQIETALNQFEATIGKTLPQDYRQHMLTYNGGIVEQDNIEHKDHTEDGGGISKFYPVSYGDYTLEKAYANDVNSGMLPLGYISIGETRGGGEIIISLNNDGTYGVTEEWYPDGSKLPLSPSFTDLINDMVEEVG